MLKKHLFYLIIVLFVVSCKTKSTATNTSAKSLSAKKIIKNHYKNTFDKNTLSAKLKVKYKGKSDLPSVTANLRMKKNEVIWISISKIGFPIGKLLITPEKVSYYEKINRTYFDGDFELLSNWLGTELDFDKVQNLILGQAVLNLKNEKHLATLSNKNYELKPAKNNELFKILYVINSGNFKVDKQQIIDPEKGKTLTIAYNNYKSINGVIFPESLLITADDKKYVSTVTANYRSVEFNKTVNFPFKIPSGYKEIELK